MNIQVGRHYRDRQGNLVRCTGKDNDPQALGLFICAVVGPVQKDNVQRRHMHANGKFLLRNEHYWDFVEEIL